MDEIGKDDVSKPLLDFHQEVVTFSQFIQELGEKKFEKVKRRPISHGAYFRIHTSAIVLHEVIRDNCLIGWAQICSILLRSLLDCLINIGVIGEKDHDFRAFCYFYHYQLSKLTDSSVSKQEKAVLRTELQKGLDLLSPEEQTRVEDLMGAGKVGGPYWFSYEYPNPSTVIKELMNPQIRAVYNFLSGATHGGHVTSGLFLDEPDKHQIIPRRNPKSAPLAVIYSTRFLLEVCHVRVHHELPESQAVMDSLMNKFLSMESVIKAWPA